MAKRWYFVNKIIDDSKLPFVIEITSGFTVYYRMREGRDKGVLRRADSMLVPKMHHIIIDVLGYNILATGIDTKGSVTYVVYKDGEVFSQYKKEEESANTEASEAPRTE